jgi:hypothetical protein
MTVVPLKEYVSVEKVKARPIKEGGETIMTSSHGIETVFSGYLVYTQDGRQEYMAQDSFEARYDEVKAKPEVKTEVKTTARK